MRMSARRLTMDAMLIAMYFLLSLIAIDLWGMKLTLEGLPVIICAMLFGPVDGLLVGLLGSFMNQMLKFGFSATTLLWILPAGVRGLTVGLFARRRDIPMTYPQTIFIVVLSALIVSTLNTYIWYIDSLIYGYYTYEVVFGGALLRYSAGILTAMAFSLILPKVLRVIVTKVLNKKK